VLAIDLLPIIDAPPQDTQHRATIPPPGPFGLETTTTLRPRGSSLGPGTLCLSGFSGLSALSLTK